MALPPHGVTDGQAKNSSASKIGRSNSVVGSALNQKEIEHRPSTNLLFVMHKLILIGTSKMTLHPSVDRKTLQEGCTVDK